MRERHDQLRRKAVKRAAVFLSLCTGIMLVALVLSLFVFDERGMVLPLAVVVLLNVGLFSLYFKQSNGPGRSAQNGETR